jgi:ankyrin repeat protein
MQAGASADICGVHSLPLLHFAVMSRNPMMVEALLAAGISPNPAGASLSALHSAVAIGSAEMVRILVSAGADTTFQDAFGSNALDWAGDLGDLDSNVIDLLKREKGRPKANVYVALRTA